MVTEKQVAALKSLIDMSKDGMDTTKLVLFFLIDASERMSREVSVTLTEGADGYTDHGLERSANELVKMRSRMGTTHLKEIMAAMGVELDFSVHYGHYGADLEFNAHDIKIDDPGHLLDREKMPTRFTFWLSKEQYGYSEELLQIPSVSREDLFGINSVESHSSMADRGRRLVRKGVTR